MPDPVTPASAPTPTPTPLVFSPHRLDFEAGPSWLSMGGPTASGYTLQGRLGSSFRLSDSWNFALHGVFSHSHFSLDSDSLSRTSIGFEMGPEVTLARNVLGLGLYGGFHQVFYYSQGIPWDGTRRVSFNNAHAASFSLRPTVLLFGGLLTAAFEWDQDFGLKIPGPTEYDPPSPGSPSRYSLLFALDLLKLFYLVRGGPEGPRLGLGQFLMGIQPSATAETSYSHSFNQPAEVGGVPGANAYRANDPFHNRLRLNQLRLGLERPSTAESPFGFRFDFNFGQDPGTFAPRDSINVPVTGARGDPGTQYFALQQAYLTYRLPVLEGFTLQAGQFGTTVGAEVADGPSNTWLLLSRGLLTTQAQPYYHAGALMRMKFSPQVEGIVGGVNGWDSTFGHEPGGTAVTGLNLTLDPVTLGFNYLIGDAPGGARGLFDFVGQWNVSDTWSLGTNIDIGHGHDATTGRGGMWYGVALYQQAAPTPWFRATAREEIFGDPQGIRTGVSQNLASLTFGTTFLIPYGFGIGPEIRYDASFNRGAGIPGPFAAGTGNSDNNVTFGIRAFWRWPDLYPSSPPSAPPAAPPPTREEEAPAPSP